MSEKLRRVFSLRSLQTHIFLLVLVVGLIPGFIMRYGIDRKSVV